MTPSASAMWRHLPGHMGKEIEERVAKALGKRDGNTPCTVFFRADDVAVPGKQLARLMALFIKFGAPLCLAVVPAWLTRQRWRSLSGLGQRSPSLWCWHQHGWRHANHEKEGRKQEFGPSRSTAQIAADLRHGQERLQSIMGEAFVPIFTPPWNRCSNEALGQLRSNGFQAVSRSRGQKPAALPGLPDLFVNVDLHTRKEPDPRSAWASLFRDMEAALSQNYCGIMIHHRLMNDAAYQFLESLLGILKARREIHLCRFEDVLDGGNRR